MCLVQLHDNLEVPLYTVWHFCTLITYTLCLFEELIRAEKPLNNPYPMSNWCLSLALTSSSFAHLLKTSSKSWNVLQNPWQNDADDLVFRELTAIEKSHYTFSTNFLTVPGCAFQNTCILSETSWTSYQGQIYPKPAAYPAPYHKIAMRLGGHVDSVSCSSIS